MQIWGPRGANPSTSQAPRCRLGEQPVLEMSSMFQTSLAAAGSVSLTAECRAHTPSTPSPCSVTTEISPLKPPLDKVLLRRRRLSRDGGAGSWRWGGLAFPWSPQVSECRGWWPAGGYRDIIFTMGRKMSPGSPPATGDSARVGSKMHWTQPLQESRRLSMVKNQRREEIAGYGAALYLMF